MKIYPGRAEGTALADATRDDQRLSVTALGLLDVLLAAGRHHRELTMDVLARHRGPGREQLLDATRDLIALGYVARVKHQSGGGRWATDLYAFATPATGEELAELRERYPDAVSVAVEPDAPSAATAGAQPSNGEVPAAAGGGGRSAAPPEEPAEDPERAGARAVRGVLAQLPGPLAVLLPQHLPATVLEAVRRELEAGRTPEQLAERIQRRWELHGYADKAAAGALQRPLGVAVALVRHGECPDRMCEDGVRDDTGAACPRCAERREEHHRARRAAAPAARPGTAVFAPADPMAGAARPTPTPPPFASLQLGTAPPDPATTSAGLGRARAALAAAKNKTTSAHGSGSAR
ncbi:hypothetical protein ACPC54_19310 [Kitasatospora sp. NPDC094028]